MSTRSLLITALSAAVVAAACATAAQAAAPGATPPAATAPATPPTPRGRGAGPTVPANLEGAMSEMNRMLQDLKKVAADPAQAEQALKDLATFERDVSISKLLVPSQISRIADAKARAEALTSYRAMMSGLMKAALDLEDAVNDKKPDEAKKVIATLEEIEKQGHAELKVGND